MSLPGDTERHRETQDTNYPTVFTRKYRIVHTSMIISREFQSNTNGDNFSLSTEYLENSLINIAPSHRNAVHVLFFEIFAKRIEMKIRTSNVRISRIYLLFTMGPSLGVNRISEN